MAKFMMCVLSISILSACGVVQETGEDDKIDDGVAQSSAAITETATATLTVTTNTATRYCATVNLRNTGAATTNTWTVVVNLNNTTGPTGTNDNLSVSAGRLTITPNGNGAIAPNALANPAPTFCVNRTSRTRVPTVASASGNYCGTYYYDNDGDGYGNTSQSFCNNPPAAGTGWVSTGGDCCDADSNANPAQTNFFTTPNACGSFDYNCDTIAYPKSNGPTGCSDGPYTCSVINNACVQDNSNLPPACNGNSVSYGTAACGQTWYVTATGCASGSGIPGQVICVGWGNGYPQGPQACR